MNIISKIKEYIRKVPDSLLLCKSIKVRDIIPPSAIGITPILKHKQNRNMNECKHKSKYLQQILPVKLLLSRRRLLTKVKLPNDEGILPILEMKMRWRKGNQCLQHIEYIHT